jgi:hypothetical protein
VFHEARTFGRKYGAIPMLARATAMAAGLHLTLFDFEGAEALQSEACELAHGLGFIPPIISAGIDSLLTFARLHDPGRAERLLEETAAAAASAAGWHQDGTSGCGSSVLRRPGPSWHWREAPSTRPSLRQPTASSKVARGGDRSTRRSD